MTKGSSGIPTSPLPTPKSSLLFFFFLQPLSSVGSRNGKKRNAKSSFFSFRAQAASSLPLQSPEIEMSKVFQKLEPTGLSFSLLLPLSLSLSFFATFPPPTLFLLLLLLAPSPAAVIEWKFSVFERTSHQSEERETKC